jgi:hypothetical protein
LGSGRFAAKTPNYERWIVLDFLGFSRQNRDLSMSTRLFRKKKNLAPFFAAAAPERGAKALGHSDGAGSLIPQA